MDRPPISIVRRGSAIRWSDGRLARPDRLGPRWEPRGGDARLPLTGMSMKKLVLLVLVVSFSLHGLMAQSVTSLLQGRTQAQEPTPATADPLEQETPSGTVLGFLQAAQFGNYKTASDYLQISAAHRPSQGPDLADELTVLMERP